jgi:hypothetical protein
MRRGALRGAGGPLALVLLLGCAHPASPPGGGAPADDRAQPLHRFAASRAAGTDPSGFYAMALAVGDDYFDGTDDLERVRRHLRVAREVGARYLRCAFSWNGIEPEPGRLEWRFWDQLVDEAERAGIELIPYVAYTPAWAAREPREFWRQPPRDPELYARVVFEAVRRYRGRIRAWEIWNEPDLAEYWQGSVAEFAALVRRAAAAMRRADPDAVIVLGGMSRPVGPFLHALLETHRIDRWVDVVAMHAYPESWHAERAETVFERWLALTAALAARRAPLDLWLDEMGYADYRLAPDKASLWGTPVHYRYEHTPEYAATFLFKAFAQALASERVSLAGWYRIDDFPESETRLGVDRVHHHLGLVDAAGRPKPALGALRFFNRLLGGPSRVHPAPSTARAPAQAVVRVFERQDGEVVVVGWLRSSEAHEVASRSGLLEDPRRETHAVGLPCQAAGVRFYDAQGRPVTGSARVVGRQLEGMTLDGEHVFVARMRCEP